MFVEDSRDKGLGHNVSDNHSPPVNEVPKTPHIGYRTAVHIFCQLVAHAHNRSIDVKPWTLGPGQRRSATLSGGGLTLTDGTPAMVKCMSSFLFTFFLFSFIPFLQHFFVPSPPPPPFPFLREVRCLKRDFGLHKHTNSRNS